MRKRGIFGVVIAALLGVGFLAQHETSQTHPVAAVGLNDSALISMPSGVHAALVRGSRLPQGFLHQAATPQTGAALAALNAMLAPPPPRPLKPKPKPRPKPRPVVVVRPPVVTTTTTTPPPPPPPPPPAPVVSAPPAAPSGGVWAELRQCESSGDYGANTGNGFYGAYQFTLSTWEGLGYSGLPSSAPPAEQDAAAQQLEARSGWGQWPACSARLGL
jgi:hypothetical protein